MLILETERLQLRTVSPDDAPFYLELVNEPSWIRFIGDRGIRTLDAARAAILDGPVAMYERLGYSLYLVQRRSDGAALGMCGLIKRDVLPDTDIGYAISPRYWGQGYAYEAAAAVVAHARGPLGLARLMAITSPDNAASIQLLGKLGMQFVERTQLQGWDAASNVYRLEL
ncbi:GNAT family N-acetyltransferase [Pseudoduganella aquatica]|uniref:GNAT family N-acetyltransferase n=1 Tax=Pseudoduganella aquatica TaxID=2660641 RepID=A0A7X4HEF7_9BURK|nr:GNAT family N-acetyltransferase [Pseudoduganella aquatica]MYN09037.1 GNAT family N-acetyltransferase [Pseudoduganella aquatica]